MKAQTLKQRISESLSTKNGQIANKYIGIYEFIRKAERYHGCQWNGGINHMTLQDSKHRNLCEALTKLGIDYVVGNDAPRGGATGTYVELTAKGKRQTAELRKELQEEHDELMRKLTEEEEQRKAEAEMQIQWYNEQCDKTYESCKGIDIFGTETAKKYGITFRNLKNATRKVWQPILHELAAELKQFNNAGFKKYVWEQFQPGIGNTINADIFSQALSAVAEAQFGHLK